MGTGGSLDLRLDQQLGSLEDGLGQTLSRILSCDEARGEEIGGPGARTWSLSGAPLTRIMSCAAEDEPATPPRPGGGQKEGSVDSQLSGGSVDSQGPLAF